MAKVLDNGVLRDARQGEIPAPVVVVAVRWKVLKSTLIRRMTDVEVTAHRALLATLPLRQQSLWEAVRWLWSDDSDIQAAGVALGWSSKRMGELLATDADADKEIPA